MNNNLLYSTRKAYLVASEGTEMRKAYRTLMFNKAFASWGRGPYKERQPGHSSQIKRYQDPVLWA